MLNTEDIKKLLVEKYKSNDFRITKDGTKTVELQNVHFICDKDWIVREPNYDYAQREIAWYESQSLNVYDIEGTVPTIWKQVADVNGDINSNYGWMIFSKENGSQYQNCLWSLLNDPTTRQAVMIYNRPSMQQDWNKNHMHDFCCTFAVQCFLNEKVDDSIPVVLKSYYELKYIVYQRSCDAIFGFNNDHLWHKYVANKIATDLSNKLNCEIKVVPIEYNAGSLHVYERHFKFLEN